MRVPQLWLNLLMQLRRLPMQFEAHDIWSALATEGQLGSSCEEDVALPLTPY